MPDTTTTSLDLDAIDASVIKATPGPYEPEWETCDCGGDSPCGHGKWIYALRLPEPHTDRDGEPMDFDFLYSEVGEFTPETLQFFIEAREKVPALVAEVRRLRARWASSQRSVGELIDRAENVEFRQEDAAKEIATLRSALDQLTDAAETVLAEAEQAETDAVFSNAPEPKRSPCLKALREALNAMPALDTGQAEQDEAVSS